MTKKQTIKLPAPEGINIQIDNLDTLMWGILNRLVNEAYEGRHRQNIDLQFAAKLGRLIAELRKTSSYCKTITVEGKRLAADFNIKEISEVFEPISMGKNWKEDQAEGTEVAKQVAQQLLDLQSYQQVSDEDLYY